MENLKLKDTESMRRNRQRSLALFHYLLPDGLQIVQLDDALLRLV